MSWDAVIAIGLCVLALVKSIEVIHRILDARKVTRLIEIQNEQQAQAVEQQAQAVAASHYIAETAGYDPHVLPKLAEVRSLSQEDEEG